MVANIRCAEIAADQLAALQRDQAWLGLVQEAAASVVPGFGERAASLIDSNLAGAQVVHGCQFRYTDSSQNES